MLFSYTSFLTINKLLMNPSSFSPLITDRNLKSPLGQLWVITLDTNTFIMSNITLEEVIRLEARWENVCTQWWLPLYTSVLIFFIYFIWLQNWQISKPTFMDQLWVKLQIYIIYTIISSYIAGALTISQKHCEIQDKKQ